MGATSGTPSPGELFKMVLATALTNLNVALVGKVLSYDASKQVADIQPVVKRLVPSGVSESEVVEDLPTLPSVRVLTLRGGGFFLHFPLKPGDTVLVVCLDRDTAPWFRKGESSAPGDQRLHHLSNAIAIPGLFPSVSAFVADPDNLTLGKLGGLIVRILDGEVHVDGNAEDVALASRVEALEDWANTHIHQVPGVTAGSASATSAVPTTPSSNGPFGSTVLKVGS